jgi:hypothetical protein
MRLSSESSYVLADLLGAIAGVREERKVWCLTLTAIASHLGADSGAIFLHKRSLDRLYKIRSLGEGEGWDMEIVLDFFHNRRPRLDETAIMAPVRAGRRVIGVLALGRGRPFERGAGKEATEMLKAVGYWTGVRQDLARQQAECATARAILQGVGSKDLSYRILHHLRRFIDYNHGATLIGVAGTATGRVLARQVAWDKGKSDLIGLEFPLTWKQVPFDGRAVILSPGEALLKTELSEVREPGSPAKKAILIGPLASHGTGFGLVEIASSRPGFFGESDAAILGRFMPYLAWCVKTFPAGAVD